MAATHAFLMVPRKDGDPVDYRTGLRTFIAENYDEPLGTYDDVLGQLSQLKAAATMADVHVNSIAAIKRYYYQLSRLADKFPINSHSTIKLGFAWSDSLKGGRKLKNNEIGYEMACVLYNYGAILSGLGSQVTLDDNGCKEACSDYQGAAGAFLYIKENLIGRFPHVDQSDLNIDCLGALSSLCLAQAQECFLQKAILGNMKEGVVARLAAQASDYYESVANSFESASLRGHFSKEWVASVNLKHHYFGALAAHNQALSLAANQKFGLAIAYWQTADQQIKLALKQNKAAKTQPVQALADKINEHYRQTSRDNDVIYHELIPTTVEPLPRAAMVKPETPAMENGEDLLSNLKPLAIRRAYARYQDDARRLVRNESERLDAQVKEGNTVLSNCAMPSSLDALTQPQGVPAGIVEKANRCLGQGGVLGLRTQIDNMRSLNENNREMLRESLRLLDEEESLDNAMRNRHIADWTRTPSSVLTKELRAEASMFQSKLDSATQADGTVKKKFEENYNIIDTLCKPNELQNVLPSSTAQSSTEPVNAIVKELRGLLAEYDQAQKAVPALKDMVRGVKPADSIETKLLHAATSAVDENTVIGDALKELYGSAQAEIDANIKLQRKLLDTIKTKAAQFHSLATTNDASRKRETVLRNLGIAYDKYMELSQNLQEGQRFYNDLTNRLLKFQQKCSDFCVARKEELEHMSRQQQVRPPPSRPPQPPSRQPSHAPAPGFWQPGMPVQYEQSAPYPAANPQAAYNGNPGFAYAQPQQQYGQPYYPPGTANSGTYNPGAPGYANPPMGGQRNPGPPY